MLFVSIMFNVSLYLFPYISILFLYISISLFLYIYIYIYICIYIYIYIFSYWYIWCDIYIYTYIDWFLIYLNRFQIFCYLRFVANRHVACAPQQEVSHWCAAALAPAHRPADALQRDRSWLERGSVHTAQKYFGLGLAKAPVRIEKLVVLDHYHPMTWQKTLPPEKWPPSPKWKKWKYPQNTKTNFWCFGVVSAISSV